MSSKKNIVIGGVIAAAVIVVLFFVPINETSDFKSPPPIMVLTNYQEEFEISPISCKIDEDIVEMEFSITNNRDDNYNLEIELALSNNNDQDLSREAILVPIKAGQTLHEKHQTPFNSDMEKCVIKLDRIENIGMWSDYFSTITQQNLKEMVDNWMNNPEEDDRNQRLEIMKAYYTFLETGQQLTQDREGLVLMNQIRKMVSLDIPKEELDQLKQEIHDKFNANETEKGCSIQCLVYDPVCGEDGTTYACGIEDAACHNVKVIHDGECSISKTRILYVDSKLVDCVGVSPQQCMLVREDTDSDWQMFYDKIEGFDFQEGMQYKLKVMVTNVENPPADSSSLKYTLIEVLEP